MPSLVLSFSPAKVNLALSVSPPIEGGMHGISSWMVTTAFGDELEVKRLPADRPSRFSIDWHEDARRRTDIDWPIRKDLAVRAHALLEQKLGCALPIQLRLKKRIPIGGGLGGGSSNAAAMLRALDALFDLRLRAEYLEAIARELGSDVPFLVRGGSALVEGTGERLARVAMPLVHLVLVFPSVACPTGPVYRAFDRLRPDARLDAPRVRALVDAADTGALRADMPFNDLADAACEVAPALAELRARVERIAQSPVHVSGSGSTLFVVCDSPIHAEALAGAIEMQAGVPAVATATAPVPLEEVDGEPRAIGAGAQVDDD
jgi:4-diphosphocytidyl-2-C-methyl-D-erythritol kinase